MPLVSTKFMTLGVKITPKKFYEIGHWSNFAQIFFILLHFVRFKVLCLPLCQAPPFKIASNANLEFVLVVFLVGVSVGHEVDVADGLAEHGVAVRNLIPEQVSS